MEKYLTIMKSRFRFSHEFCYIPSDDLSHLLNNTEIIVNLEKDGTQ